MPVPNPPKLSDVIAEFGTNGSPLNLGAYVRGGAYVPDTAANAAVSISASSLALSQFIGATKTTPVLTLATRTHENEAYFSTHVSSSIELANNGIATYGGNSGPVSYLNEWLTGGTASNYHVYAELLSGTLTSSSPVNQYISLGTTRSWAVDATNATSTAVLRMHIGTIASGTYQIFSDITIRAKSFAGPPA